MPSSWQKEVYILVKWMPPLEGAKTENNSSDKKVTPRVGPKVTQKSLKMGERVLFGSLLSRFGARPATSLLSHFFVTRIVFGYSYIAVIIWN